MSLSAPVLIALITAAIAAGLPLLLAALGETLGEQAGVLNLGLEGMLLIGAFTGFVVTLGTESFWLGLLAGAAAGAVTSLLLAALSVWAGLNQIVVGIAITLAGSGLTSVLYTQFFAVSNPRLGLAPPWRLPLLSEIPVLGPSLFSQPGMFTVALALAAAVAYLLHRTAPGLRLRAAGQLPASLDAAGGNVWRTRTVAVLSGGAFAGLGGATLAVLSAGAFTPFMTHGLGYLAIVVTMLARGRIAWVVLAAFAYGLLVASGTVLQLLGVEVPTDLIKMLPFIAVMLVLVLLGRQSGVPAALTTHYVRGER